MTSKGTRGQKEKKTGANVEFNAPLNLDVPTPSTAETRGICSSEIHAVLAVIAGRTLTPLNRTERD